MKSSPVYITIFITIAQYQCFIAMNGLLAFEIDKIVLKSIAMTSMLVITDDKSLIVYERCQAG